MRLWAFVFAALLLAPLVAATDYPPTTDYGQFRHNLSCTNSPVYDPAQRAFWFGPNGNQKCDPAVNFTSAQFPSSSPATVFAWVRFNGTNPPGTSQHLINTGFDFAANAGYSFRMELNATEGLRLQVVTGGTFNTGTFAAGYATGQWVPILYEITGSRVVGRVGTPTTISLNVSGTPRNFNSSTGGNNQLFGSGTAGGYSNGMWNGTAKDVRVWNRTLSFTEIQALFANETFRSTSGVVAYWSFENTTSVNVTVSAVDGLAHPQDFMGFHTAPLIGNGSQIDVNDDGTLDTPSNITYLRSVFQSVGARLMRVDFNPDEQCSYNTFLPITADNCAWSTLTASNGRNINITRDIVDYAAANDFTVSLVAESVPATLASNNSECNGGAGSDWARCYPTNVTRWVDAIVEQYYYVTRGGTNERFVQIEIWNEPYLSQFWLPNSSVSCATRAQRIVELVSAALPELRQRLPNATILGPSVTFGASSCGPTVAAALGGNFSGSNPNSSQRFDRWNAHEYGSSGVMAVVSENIRQQAATARLYGYATFDLTEFLPNNAAVTQNDSVRFRAETAHAILTAHLQNVTGAYLFQLSNTRPWGVNTSEWPIQYPQVYPGELGGPQVRGGAQAINATQRLNLGTVRLACSTTDSNVTCSVVRNGTRYQVVLASVRPNQIEIDNITVSSRTVTGAYSFAEASAKTFSGSVVAGGFVPYFGVASWEVNVTDFTPPTISSVLAIATTSTFQVNYSCSEACNGSVNYGTSTALGTRASATGFVASQVVNVTGLADSTTYYYNVTACDAAGNCATSGPFNVSTVLTIAARSATITSATNDVRSDALLYCSGEVAGGGRVTHGYQVWRNGVLNSSVTVPAYSPTGVCEQSQFNASGTCGLANGTYAISAVSPGSGNGAYITIVAQKPIYAYNASIRVVSGINRTGTGRHDAEYELAPGCWDASPSNVTIRHFTSANQNTGRFRSECWNGTSWRELYSEILCTSSSTGPTGLATTTYEHLYDANFSTGISYYQSGTGDSWAQTTVDTSSLSCGSLASNFAAVLYGSSFLWDYGSLPNASTYVGMIPRASLAKGVSWQLACYASNGQDNSPYLNSSVFVVQNAPPNATAVSATPIAGGVNCTYVYADPDGDAESGSTYRWFRNASLLGVTTRTLGSGNYSALDQVVCEATPRDGTTFGAAANSSAYVAGDTTPPTVSSVTVPPVASTSDVVRLLAVCTDEYSIASGGVTVSWVAPNGTREANRTMTVLSGSTYYLDWVFLSGGYYSGFAVACTDGSGNAATLSTSATLAVTAGGGVGTSGGGGGGPSVVIVSASGVEIVKPAARKYSVSCAAEEVVDDFEVQLYNPTGTDATYSFKTTGVSCSAVPDVSVPAKSARSVFVSGCACAAQGETVKGSLDIYDSRAPGVVAASLPITLAENILGLLLDPVFVIGSVAVVGLAILFVVLGARR